MIYARNTDRRHWRAICVLPAGSGMTVLEHCFGGTNKIIYIPSQEAQGGGIVAAQDAASPPRTIFSNNNPAGVGSNPSRPTSLNLDRNTVVTKITTYHWNFGRGTPEPGMIGLRSDSGRVYGPWGAKGSSGQGGVPNAYWVVTPNVELPAGYYTIVDSEPTTWAQNRESGGAGMAWIEGVTR